MIARNAVRLVLLVAISFANLNELWSPDVVPNALLSWTLIREGNADYDERYGFGLVNAAAAISTPSRRY